MLYGYASEKVPWLVVHLALPLALLAGMTLGRLLDKIDWRETWRSGGALYVAALLLSLAALNALLGQVSALGPPNSVNFAQPSPTGLAYALVLLAVFGSLVVRYGRRLGRTLAQRPLSLPLIALLMAFSIHTAVQASFYNGDVPVEMLVYTQTTRDVGKVMRQVEDLTYRTGSSKEKFKVAYDGGVSWPFEWYLRDYQAREFYGSGLPDPDVPIVLASFEDDTASRVETFLGDRYVGQRYQLRAWFDESDYRRIGEDPALLWRALTDPTTRGKLWRFLVYREPLKPSGLTDFVVFVRRDLT